MKIYQVTENDTQLRFYWFATKREALMHLRSYIRCGGMPDCVDMTVLEIDHSKQSLVDTMNWIISLTCFNEG